MNPRQVLELLLERIEADVGPASDLDFSRYGSEPPPEFKNRLDRGWFFLAKAAIWAREALASGHEGRMALAANICQSYERQAREIERRNAGKAFQRKAGRRRAAQQAAQANPKWAPYIALYQKQVAVGVEPRIARSRIDKKMRDDGFINPMTGELWSARTLSRRLK